MRLHRLTLPAAPPAFAYHAPGDGGNGALGRGPRVRAMIVWPAKDPTEVLDYTWMPPLDTGDTIASFSASVGTGTVSKDSASNTDAAVTLWLSGGADGETDTINLSATTAGGRTFREVAILPVFDRASDLLALFRLRYPAFASVADGVLGYWLGDAALTIGAAWPEPARDPAKLMLAAHTVELLGLRNAGQPIAGVTSFRSGSFSANISDTAANRTGFDATIYGREFLILRRTSFIGISTAWAAPLCVPGMIPGDCDV